MGGVVAGEWQDDSEVGVNLDSTKQRPGNPLEKGNVRRFPVPNFSTFTVPDEELTQPCLMVGVSCANTILLSRNTGKVFMMMVPD